MGDRLTVLDKFQITGRGPAIIVILDESQFIKVGDQFREEATGATVTIWWVDLHNRKTEDGILQGLFLEENGADAVKPGSVLIKMTTEAHDG